MKQLWAPWRLEYVRNVSKKFKGEEKDGCVFCDLFNQSEPSEDNLVLVKSDHWAVVLNRYPYSTGHVLILPIQHVADMHHLPDECMSTLGKVLALTEQSLHECYAPHGINIGLNLGRAAGAGIPEHLHFHVVCRWIGDTNFMPVLAEIRCINDHVSNMYNRLQPYLQKAFKEGL